MAKQTTLSKKDSLKSEVDFVVYYAHDGKPLADYIKQRFSDKKLQCSVDTKDFGTACKSNTRISDSKVAKVTVLIVSPIMISVMPQMKPFVKDLFPIPDLSVAICIHTELEKVTSLLSGVVEQFEEWTKCLIEDSRASFRNCLVTLMTLLEDCDTEPLPTMKLFHLVPSTVNSNTEKIHIIFTKKIDGQVEVRYCDHVMSVIVYNPYTAIFSPPDKPVQSADVEVRIDGVSIGKETLFFLSKKDEVTQLIHDIINPLEFLSETLFSEKVQPEDLDAKLAKAFEDDIQTKLIDVFRQVENIKLDDYVIQQDQPTLLHFAAKLDLRKLTSALLKLPGANHASFMLNSMGWSAEDIARMNGHTQLADMIRTFKEKHIKNPPEKDPAYVDMKQTIRMSRSGSNPATPVCPPIPQTPRPQTDPSVLKTSANNRTTSGDVFGDLTAFHRQLPVDNSSILRDDLERKSFRRHRSTREQKRSDRVTLLIQDPLVAGSRSDGKPVPSRPEREYATIDEILEDLQTYSAIAEENSTVSRSTAALRSVTSSVLPVERKSKPEPPLKRHGLVETQKSIYDIPKPILRRK